MVMRFLCFVLMVNLSVLVYAAPIQPQTQAPEQPEKTDILLESHYPVSYVIQPGDTLWSISSQFLQDPLQWPQLWPGGQGPKNLYPGDILTLTFKGTTPQLSVHEGGTIKLKPSVRSVQLNEPVPAIPLNIIKPYLVDMQIIDPKTLNSLPTVLEVEDEHVVGGAGDSINVANLPSGGIPGKMYFIYRKLDTFTLPETQKVLGIAMLEIGQGTLSQVGNPASLYLTSTNREVEGGDYIVMKQSLPQPQNYRPRLPTIPIRAKILSVLDGVIEAGQYNVVVLDKGSKDGLVVGDILTIIETNDAVLAAMQSSGKTYSRPIKKEGTLMVFRTTPQISLGLILDAKLPIHVLDVAVNPKSVG